jgi:hypothetical protein
MYIILQLVGAISQNPTWESVSTRSDGRGGQEHPQSLRASLWSAARLRFVRHTDGQGPRVSELGAAWSPDELSFARVVSGMSLGQTWSKFGVHVERRSIWDDDSQWRSIDQVISRAQPAGRYVLGCFKLFPNLREWIILNYFMGHWWRPLPEMPRMEIFHQIRTLQGPRMWLSFVSGRTF